MKTPQILKRTTVVTTEYASRPKARVLDVTYENLGTLTEYEIKRITRTLGLLDSIPIYIETATFES